LGLTYEIVTLEVVADAPELAKAERWWIAFGRACGWPLTNITDGRGPSEAAIGEKHRREAAREAEAVRCAEWDALVHLTRLDHERKLAEPHFAFFDAHRDNPRVIAEAVIAFRETFETIQRQHDLWREHKTTSNAFRSAIAGIEKRCLQFFEKNFTSKRGRQLITDGVIAERVPRDMAEQLYAQWRSQNPNHSSREEIREAQRRQSFRLFAQGKPVGEVAAEIRVEAKIAKRFYSQWARAAYKRGKQELAKDRWALFQRLQAAKDSQRHEL
jgi:hypothetical protein